MSVILASATAVTANQSVIDERIVAQGFPSTVSGQLGNKLVAIRATHLGVRVFAATPREDGAMRVRMSLSGRNVGGELVAGKKGDDFNFTLAGWVTVYPESMGVPGFISIPDADWKALEYFEVYKAMDDAEKAKSKKPGVWFETFVDDVVYAMVKLDEGSHYLKDAAGNKIPDPAKPGKFLLDTHPELQLVAAYFEATLHGQESSGGGVAVDKDALDAAKAALEALEAAAASRHAV